MTVEQYLALPKADKRKARRILAKCVGEVVVTDLFDALETDRRATAEHVMLLKAVDCK